MDLERDYGPTVGRYLRALVEESRKVLGDNLVGTYLTGSLALGEYVAGTSDIDVAVVVGGPLSRTAKGDLVDRLRHARLPCPARGLELVVYRAEAVGQSTLDPAFEVELNDGPRMDFRATYDAAERDRTDGTFWYPLDRDIVAARGVALSGPAAAGVFATLRDDQLRDAVVESLRWHATQPDPTGNAVLNACRSLVRIETGRWIGKSAAGRRALELGVPAAPVEAALRQRSGEDLTPADAEPFLRYIRHRVRAAR